jgi:phosphonate transport system substrate-binding protein
MDLPLLACRALCMLFACVVVRAAPEISVGIEPYFSPVLLISTFEPLRDALEKSLATPIVLLTAGDYRQFVTRIQRQEFDVVMIGPHGARYAQIHAGYVPVLIGRTRLSGVIVVRRDSKLVKPDELARGTVALPDSLTLTSMLAEEWFDQQHLAPSFRHYPFHNAAVLAVLHGDAVAAVVNKTALAHMPADMRDNLRVLAETRAMPNSVVLINGRVDGNTRAHYVDAIQAYVNSTEQGDSFAGRLGFSGVDPIKPDDLALVEPFAAELERRMKASP